MEWKRYHEHKVAWRYANRFLEQDKPLEMFYEIMNEELRKDGWDDDGINRITRTFESAVRQMAILGGTNKED